MKSIRLKLTVFISLLVVLVLVIQGIVILQFTRNELENQAKNMIYFQAEQLAELLRHNQDNNEVLNERIRKLSEEGTAAIIDSYGYLKYYHDNGLIGQKLTRRDAETSEDLIETIMNTKDDFINYKIRDAFNDEVVDRIAYIKYEPDTKCYVVIEKNLKDVFKTSNRIALISISLIVGSIIICIIAGYFVASSFTKPIRKLVDASTKVSGGDLTYTVQIRNNDEIGLLSKSFNNMVKSLREITIGAKEVSIAVEKTANTLVEMVNQTTAAINQVSIAVEEIADGASNQAHESEKGVKKGEILDENAKLIETNARDMKDYTDEMREMSIEGIKVMGDLLNKQRVSNQSIDEICKVINTLGQQIDKISEFTTTISNIAEETNLLALNAAIEAARAGESGKGFAVVAEEIRKLAEESNIAADEIQDIISVIHSDAKKASEAVDKAKDISDIQNDAVNATNNIFRKLEEAISLSNEKIQNVYEYIEKLAKTKNQVIDAINNIYKITEDTAASSEEVSATVQEQTASMEEISHYIQELANRAVELKTSINKFKI